MSKKTVDLVPAAPVTKEALTNELLIFNPEKAIEIATLEYVASEWKEETAELFKWEEGQMHAICVSGDIVELPKKDEEGTYEAAHFTDAKGGAHLNADVMFISTVKRLIAQGSTPCVVAVFADGEKGTGKKVYRNLSIRRYVHPTATPNETV